MKKLVICIGLSIAVQQGAMGQATVLYTNAPDGETVTLMQDVTVYNDPSNTARAVGISFDAGNGSGALDGSGDFSVNNLATASDGGASALYGIQGVIVTTAQYTGHISVTNDRSSFIGDATTARASARGISGGVEGDVNGDIVVVASSGSYTGDGIGNATAAAYGIGVRSVPSVVNGDINGTIRVTATGGTSSHSSFAFSSAEAAGIVSADQLGDINGTIMVTATGGTSFTPGSLSYANASAHGIDNSDGGAVSFDMSGDIVVTAIGGTASAPDMDAADAFAYAAGIAGTTQSGMGPGLQISNFTGNIDVTAIAGLRVANGVTNVSTATAVGIGVDSRALYLNATAGSIHAAVAAPEGYGPGALPSGSKAYAILGGTGADTVLLSNVDILGDIDLGGGTNRFEILGDTSMEGDIYASTGFNDLQLTTGLLMPVGELRVANLLDRRMNISGTGGLGFTLYDDPANPLNSSLWVDGELIATNGATLAAAPAAGLTAGDVIGKSYEVITADDGITGDFAENEKSLLFVDIDVTGTNVVITPTGLKPQTGESTPAGGSVAQSTITTVQALMNDLSEHLGGSRNQLRNRAAPEGALGPVARDQKLESGEWIAYLRQINYMGAQDSEGDITGYDWNSHGFLIGGEKLVSEGLVFGASAGGMWTDLDNKSGKGGGRSEVLSGSLYGTKFTDTWYAEGGLVYAHAGSDADRIASDGQGYAGSFDSDLFGGWLEGGYNILRNRYAFEPYARVAYLRGKHDGYSDSGGTNPLTVDASTTDNLPVEAGVRGIRGWALEKRGDVRIALKAGLRAELLDNKVVTDGRLAGVNLRFSSPEADAVALVLGARADWSITDRFTLGIHYEPVVSGNWYYQTLSGELSLKF